jgi:hypothetical protein
MQLESAIASDAEAATRSLDFMGVRVLPTFWSSRLFDARIFSHDDLRLFAFSSSASTRAQPFQAR